MDRVTSKKIIIFSDVITKFGGIETYLEALADHLHYLGFNVIVAVSESTGTPMLDELQRRGVNVYRQPRIPGDRFLIRQRLLVRWLKRNVSEGDWVYCVRQPLPKVHDLLLAVVEKAGAKLAASWMLAPEFLPLDSKIAPDRYREILRRTHAVISVSKCTAYQFKKVYGYEGRVHVVPYHNKKLLARPVPLPDKKVVRIGFMGRIEMWHKNLDGILEAIKKLISRHKDVFEFNFYGDGPDIERAKHHAINLRIASCVNFHGRYSPKTDLENIVRKNHFFLYTSRMEGGPCLSLLELLQSGRYVVASRVGGIPDIYDGHPEIGFLIKDTTSDSILEGMEFAITLLRRDAIDINRIATHYEHNFSNDVAHAAWLRALNLDKLQH